MESILEALGKMTSLGAEYARADNARRQAILDNLDNSYRSYRGGLAGLPAAHKANEEAFLKAVGGLHDEVPVPPAAQPAPVPAPAVAPGEPPHP